MQKEFTTEFIKANAGCYISEEGKLLKVYQENKNEECFKSPNCTVTIDEILNANIPVKDKYWFFCKKVFTKEQNQHVAIGVAEIVLPIYEQRYPENKAPREAIEAAKLYITGHISLEDLLQKRDAAYAAAYAAADAAAYAAVAAYAVAYAADDYADYAAASAEAAAYAAASYGQKILQFLIDFCHNN